MSTLNRLKVMSGKPDVCYILPCTDINQDLLDEAAEEELTQGPFIDSFPMMSGNYGTLMQPKTESATIAATSRGSAFTGKVRIKLKTQRSEFLQTPTAFLNGQPIFSDDPMVTG
eukprot:480415-Hanusia_phi.AAC.2